MDLTEENKSEDDLQRAIALSLQDGGVTNIPTHSTTATSTVSGVSQEEQDVSKALEASLLESSLTIHAEFKPRRFAVKSCRAPEDISQACRGCPSGRHLKSVPLGVAQAQKVCHGPAPYPRGRQAMQSSIATQV